MHHSTYHFASLGSRTDPPGTDRSLRIHVCRQPDTITIMVAVDGMPRPVVISRPMAESRILDDVLAVMDQHPVDADHRPASNRAPNAGD